MSRGQTRHRGGRSTGRPAARAPRTGRHGGRFGPWDGHDETIAQLGRAIVDAARQPTGQDAPVMTTPREIARQPKRSPAELARLSAAIDRERRIEAGRRARRMPYAVTTVTGVAGYGAWGAAELAQVALGPAGHTGAVAATVSLCAIGSGAARVAFRHGIDARWTRRWWTAATAASSWVSLAATIGPDSWVMTALLTAGATAVSSTWQREHAVPEVADLPVDAPPPPDTDTCEEDLGDLLAQRWAAHVSGKKGPIPDALLTDRHDLPNAIQWTVQLPPGQVAFDQLLTQLPRIASGLRQGQSKVIFEPVADDESAAILSVVIRDVLAEGVPYTGPEYLSGGSQDGRIPVGPYADGTGEAAYVAVDGVGCRNGVATGAPGSGKSAFLEVITLGLKQSGRWWVMFADGDAGGGSSPLLNQIAHWPSAGPEQALAQLEALEEALEVRTALKATLTAGRDGTPVPITDPARQLPLREMLPSAEYPGICWVIDELHRLTNDDWLKQHDFAGRLEKIARLGRKYGIVLLLGTQSLLADDFGGNTKLRAYLSDRNCFVFRNPNKTEQHVVAGLKIAPSTLPPGGGYAYSTGTGRVSQLRVAWARDLSPWAADLPAAMLDSDTDRIISRYQPPDAGDPTILYETAAARLRTLRSGPAGTQDHGPREQTAGPTGPPVGPRSDGVRLPGPDRNCAGPHGPDQRKSADPRHSLLGPEQIPQALSAANVITLRTDHGPGTDRAEQPGPVTSENTDQTTVNGPANSIRPERVSGLSGAQHTVYDALCSLGERQLARNSQLIDLTGLEGPTVAKALSALAKKDLATKIGHGAWKAVRHTSHRAVTSADDDNENEYDKQEASG